MMTSFKMIAGALAATVTMLGLVLLSHAQTPSDADRAVVEKAVLARMAEIQLAAESLDVDKVFSFVLDNDKGALIQNGRLMLSRQAAFDATKQGFADIRKVSYQFDAQHVTLISSTVALVVGEGTTSVEAKDGQTRSRGFAQSVVLVLTNGEWKVLHSHGSFAAGE